MESRLRICFALTVTAVIVVGTCAACGKDNSNQQAVSDTVRDSIAETFDAETSDTSCSTEAVEYTDEYTGDIPYKNPNMTLNDGYYEVRLYIDDDFYRYSDDELIITTGVMNHDLKYYTDEDLASYSVGDRLVVDDDLSITIESLDVEYGIFIKNVYYEQEIIRINADYMMLHPITEDRFVNELWNLCNVRSFDGNYNYQYELSGITDICVTDNCDIIYYPYNEDYGHNYSREMSITEFMDYLFAQDDLYESPLIIYAHISIENNILTKLDLYPYSFEGRHVCLED